MPKAPGTALPRLFQAHGPSGEAPFRPGSDELIPSASCPMLLEALRAGEAACVATFDGGPEPNGDDTETGTTVQSVLPPRAALTEPGAAASRIYRVYSGLLCRARYLSDGRRQILGVYLPGDLVGTEALLWPRRADAIETLTAANVHWLDVIEARGLLAREPEAALWLMQQILDEVRRLDALATALGRADARTRVAWFLLHLWERLRLRGLGGDGRFVLPLTQQEIGDCLGLTPVHVNRVLRTFREDGIAVVRQRIATIGDFRLLRALAPSGGLTRRPR